MGPPIPNVQSSVQASGAEQGSSSSPNTTAQPSDLPFASAGHQETYELPSRPIARPKWIRIATSWMPGPLKRTSAAVVRWAKGPDPPRIYKITPLFPKLQITPITLLNRYLPQRAHKIWALLAFYFCFLLCFVTILHESAFSDEIPGYGSPLTISCTDTFWSPNNGCGLDGDDCRPFQNSTTPFRCAANCKRTQVLNPRAVGSQDINYKPLVIGGPRDLSQTVETSVYRGDSFICSSAIHSGFITNSEGGCGVVSLVGEESDFPSLSQNGINSIGFDSNFPLAFSFIQGTRGHCKDLRWPLLAVTIIFTTLLAVFTTSPSVYFGSIFCMLFFHVALVSDPPSLSNYYALVSSALGRFLPGAFCAFVIYKYCVRRQLEGLQAQIEKAILWLGPCLVGCLNNYTFDKIPIERLTPHDIKQQPGAVGALVVIVLVIFFIALGQAWAIRVEGRMPRYLAVYGIFGFTLLMLLAVPNMGLRIHHYILALLLLPGTAMQNRPSLVYQGLLLGLFINGVARWGFDSILQTPAELQGDALLGSDLPKVTSPVIGANNITFNWAPIPDGYDGMSVLVNDVERFRGYIYDGPGNFTWERRAPPGEPEYFRFGYMSGASPGDFTKAGTWTPNGDWEPMAPGPS